MDHSCVQQFSVAFYGSLTTVSYDSSDPASCLDLAGITHGFKGDQFTAIHTTARNSPYTVIFAGYICFVIAVYDGSPVASTYTTDIIVSRYGSVYGNIFDHSACIQCVEKSDLVTTTYCHCQFNSCTVSIKGSPVAVRHCHIGRYALPHLVRYIDHGHSIRYFCTVRKMACTSP